MRVLFFILSWLVLITAAGQERQEAIRSINEQVWKPFIRTFSSGDDAGFRAVHSKEMTRVIQDDNRVLTYEEYFKQVPDSVKEKWGQWARQIELRFLQRIVNGDRAFEVGFYKTTSTNKSTGEVRTGIGKFHVLLRKENGIWKIWMDADTREGAGEEAFNTAELLE